MQLISDISMMSVELYLFTNHNRIHITLPGAAFVVSNG